MSLHLCLSRHPVDGRTLEHTIPFTLVASVSGEEVPAKDGEAVALSSRQKADPELRQLMTYLESGTLPEDRQQARQIAVNSMQYSIVDDVLYHVEKDKTLRVVPPVGDREKLFHEVHGGVFGGHLRDAKIHSQLSRHYWWPAMRKDIKNWCLRCIPCATRNVGKLTRPLLTPIPVAGPFDRIGVDVIQFPKSKSGNRYALVFVDYLTKWPEVFPMADQSAATIARLFVENIICRHGVPGELLSDRGASFLSKLMLEICRLLGTRKVNTTAYHPQTDGLVERFNRTLTDMLAKTVETSGTNWDEWLPYVLFAYRSSLQQSTSESPFFLLYGRDARLPTSELLEAETTRYPFEITDYKMELMTSMSEAWQLARSNVEKAQCRQKRCHDQNAKEPKFSVGQRVFVFMPAAKSSKAYKFAKPFEGPYRITALYNNGADVCLVDRPSAPSLRVALDRLRHCPRQIVVVSDQDSPSQQKKKRGRKKGNRRKRKS